MIREAIQEAKNKDANIDVIEKILNKPGQIREFESITKVTSGRKAGWYKVEFSDSESEKNWWGLDAAKEFSNVNLDDYEDDAIVWVKF